MTGAWAAAEVRSLRQRLHERIGKSLIIARAMVTLPVTFGVRAMAIDPQRRVMLVRHSYMPGFHLPGGGVDAGESARQAALRELFEETGVAAEHAEFFGLYWNKGLANRDHVAVYAVTGFTLARRDWRPPAEIAETGFFPIDDLPDATTTATRRRLKEFESGAAPAEIW